MRHTFLKECLYQGKSKWWRQTVQINQTVWQVLIKILNLVVLFQYWVLADSRSHWLKAPFEAERCLILQFFFVNSWIVVAFICFEMPVIGCFSLTSQIPSVSCSHLFFASAEWFMSKSRSLSGKTGSLFIHGGLHELYIVKYCQSHRTTLFPTKDESINKESWS